MIDNQIIMQEMIANNENCRIVQDNNQVIAKLRPLAVTQSLLGKLSSCDIEQGMSLISRQISLSNLKTDLYRQCQNTNCIARNKCVFRAIPNGSNDADVMFLNKIPTQYEMCNMTSHCDRNGAFLTLILSKMNVSRDSVYCTDMIKCNTQLDEQSYEECIRFYLEREILYVSPKIIICNGLSVLKACIKTGILTCLPSDVTYGKIYNAKTSTNLPIKVIAIYDLDTVLQKTEESYEKCKTELWTQILTAFKELSA